MRKLTLSLIAFTAALCAAAPATHAQKVGIVDMNAIFSEYYKTKDAQAKLKEQEAEVQKDLNTRFESFKKLQADAQKLQQEAQKPELSKEGKDKSIKELGEKAQELRNLEGEINEYRQTRGRQLQEQMARMKKDIVEDIMKVVNEKVKTAGYDLVFDKSGISLGQVPVVLYSRADLDFTPEITTALNKNAPKAAPSAAQ